MHPLPAWGGAGGPSGDDWRYGEPVRRVAMQKLAGLTQGMGQEQGKKKEHCSMLGKAQAWGGVAVSLGGASKE